MILKKTTNDINGKTKSINYENVDLEELSTLINVITKTYSYGAYFIEFYNNKLVIYCDNAKNNTQYEYMIYELIDLKGDIKDND